MKSLLAFLLIASIAVNQHLLTGTIKSKTGDPVNDAVITCKGHLYYSHSDSDGNFTMDVPAGYYWLEVNRLGFLPYREEIDMNSDRSISIVLSEDTFIDKQIVVEANRAGSETPIAFKTIDQEDLAESNSGADLPLLLEFTPSYVSTSDAGIGIGYTGMRIRGTDMSRINVMINGVPLNEPESQSVFWVDLPDLTSSIESVQIQRGVGTSSNGAGAFGASINIETAASSNDASIEFNNSYGSFNSSKHTLKLASGLFADHFSAELRLSQVKSDGYIDRAFSDLQSLYLSAAYLNKNSSLNFIMLRGKEKTYQSWNGVPVELLETDRTYNAYNYENQTDNYWQNHYQMVFVSKLSDRLTLNSTLNFKHGEGYYEEYSADDNLSNYGLDTLVTNVIRRRWLDNDFYAALSNLQYKSKTYRLTAGLFYSRYFGSHFGNVIGYENASVRTELDHQYYFNEANKTDFNFFIKADYKLSQELSFFADLQYRLLTYQFELSGNRGSETVYPAFFNPKFGLNYNLGVDQSVYASLSVANKEPGRDDYVNSSAESRPKSERLFDLEMGYRLKKSDFLISTNLYYMTYKNQLALTGEINDVGEYTRVNLDKSYRLGIEIDLAYQPIKQFQINGNASISKNKIEQFT
ncbi:MAG: TonB-dependent receptor, partial [Calditrichaeota bacterium]|nr:TonB-dependent receptor [Calditrichota bacterium]